MNDAIRQAVMLAAMEGDLPRLLALGRDGLGLPLLLGGETLDVLGWSGPPHMPDGASWEDFIQAGLAPDFRWSDQLFQENSLRLDHGFSACLVPRPDGGPDWLVDIEMAGGQPLHLVLSGRDKGDAPPPDGAFLGLVCLAVRSCVNNRPGGPPQQRLSTEQLLLHLIRNREIDEPLLRLRAQSVQMDSEGFFALLMLDLRGYHPQRHSIATIRGELSAAIDGPSVIDGELLTFLVCHDTQEEGERRQLRRKAERILADNGLFGVLGRPFYRLGEFHQNYVRTLDVLKLRFCAAPGRWLVSADEMLVYSLAAALRERDAQSAPVHPAVQTLLRSDQARKTSYVETLFSYLAHGQKPALTCAALHIHRNTLDYRLRRIEELTELDWGDGDLLFRIYFSLCAMRYDQLSGASAPQ